MYDSRSRTHLDNFGLFGTERRLIGQIVEQDLIGDLLGGGGGRSITGGGGGGGDLLNELDGRGGTTI